MIGHNYRTADRDTVYHYPMFPGRSPDSPSHLSRNSLGIIRKLPLSLLDLTGTQQINECMVLLLLVV